jgi:osmotically-inducible protein OsmY
MLGPLVLVVGCSQSDLGITTSVKSQFAADDVVKAHQIDVDTRERVVTLRGQVTDPVAEAQAIEIARSTDGVADVVDQIDVVTRDAVPTAGTEFPGDIGAAGSDAAITAQVKAKLLADSDTSGLRIDVDTKDKMVTLTGTVETAAERTEALALARSVEGVTGVNDQLTVERR